MKHVYAFFMLSALLTSEVVAFPRAHLRGSGSSISVSMHKVPHQEHMRKVAAFPARNARILAGVPVPAKPNVAEDVAGINATLQLSSQYYGFVNLGTSATGGQNFTVQ